MEDQIRNLQLSGHVGFDSLPDQLVSKSVQNGFVFNIMCIGMFRLIMRFFGFIVIAFRRNRFGQINAHGFII